LARGGGRTWDSSVTPNFVKIAQGDSSLLETNVFFTKKELDFFCDFQQKAQRFYTNNVEIFA